MRPILKTLVTIAAIISFTSPAFADPPECATLLQYWNASTAANDALSDFDYWGKKDQAQTDFFFCVGIAQHSIDPASAARECEEEYTSRLWDIETEYNALHDEALITSLVYFNYLAQLNSEEIYCSIG